jgi:Holliday junction resolvase RusA-like endonuclease
MSDGNREWKAAVADFAALAGKAMTPIAFFVPGIPRPGGSKRAFFKAGMKRPIITDDAKGNREWKAAVADFAARAHTSAPLEGPLRLEIVFQVLRPKGHFGSGKNASRLKASAPAYPTVKPDVTKLVRSTEDALTGILWRDDAQVVEQVASKVYAERTGAEVRVVPLATKTAGQVGCLPGLSA